MTSCDVVFLGSSPNALTAAARLAKAGLRVVVLETRASVGGPVTTDTFAPGFRADLGLASVSIDPDVLRELRLPTEIVRRDSVTWVGPTPLTLRSTPDLGSGAAEAVELLRALHRVAPPDVPILEGADAATMASLGQQLRGLGARRMHQVLRMSTLSARDLVEERLSSEGARTLVAGAAVRALSEGPFALGTAFGWFHHAALGDALFRATAIGGLQRLSDDLAAAARAAGADVRTSVAAPMRVIVEDGVARGVRLGGDGAVHATHVVSDHDARTTFLDLVAPRELGPEAHRAIRHTRYRGSVARVHLALSGLPDFRGVDAEALRGTLVFCPDVASIERAWDDAKRGRLPARPYVEVTFPTTTDPSLAPDGRHVLDAWVQYVPGSFDDAKAVVGRVLEVLAEAAPRLASLVLHEHVSLPLDLACRFGLSEGHMYGGEVRLDQAFFLRSIAGESGYRTPIENLWLGGSAAHPGGYSGRSGENLARRLLEASAR